MTDKLQEKQTFLHSLQLLQPNLDAINFLRSHKDTIFNSMEPFESIIRIQSHIRKGRCRLRKNVALRLEISNGFLVRLGHLLTIIVHKKLS